MPILVVAIWMLRDELVECVVVLTSSAAPKTLPTTTQSNTQSRAQGAYEAQRVVTFVPPDGDFELLRYRATDGVAPPFRAVPAVKELGRTRLEAGVAVRSLFSAQLFALGVVVLVPVPDNTARAQISVTAGKAKYDATKKAIVSRRGSDDVLFCG